MNIAYTIVTTDRFANLAEIMLLSLFEHCDCKVYIDAIGKINLTSIAKIFADDRVEILNADETQWKSNRMAYRTERIGQLFCPENANVLIIDSDIYVKKNIFNWFNSDMDVLLTVRPNFYLSVNAGIWGFKNNPNSRQFISFFIQQIQKPSWKPFIEFRKEKLHEYSGRDWWIDQDFLCTVNDSGLPFPCRIHKFGCITHNCTPTKSGFVACLKNQDKHVLHMKGAELQATWVDYYNKHMRGVV
jgi:hypothetical protein